MTNTNRILENVSVNRSTLLDALLDDPTGEGLAQAYADRHQIAGPTLSDMVA